MPPLPTDVLSRSASRLLLPGAVVNAAKAAAAAATTTGAEGSTAAGTAPNMLREELLWGKMTVSQDGSAKPKTLQAPFTPPMVLVASEASRIAEEPYSFSKRARCAGSPPSTHTRKA
mmetsp:Transcript_11563/g.24413  ORF Transcript_11563/g.24413 Transcript_11563/m.24413 type:complete len:117 (-) Transcript_11563:991-1341(-)